jgi:hypothetical protein
MECRNPRWQGLNGSCTGEVCAQPFELYELQAVRKSEAVICVRLSSPPCVLHASPIPSSVMWSIRVTLLFISTFAVFFDSDISNCCQDFIWRLLNIFKNKLLKSIFTAPDNPATQRCSGSGAHFTAFDPSENLTCLLRVQSPGRPSDSHTIRLSHWLLRKQVSVFIKSDAGVLPYPPICILFWVDFVRTLSNSYLFLGCDTCA